MEPVACALQQSSGLKIDTDKLVIGPAYPLHRERFDLEHSLASKPYQEA